MRMNEDASLMLKETGVSFTRTIQVVLPVLSSFTTVLYFNGISPV